MDLAHVDLTPAPAGVAVSFVESEWHRISAELESERAVSQLAAPYRKLEAAAKPA